MSCFNFSGLGRSFEFHRLHVRTGVARHTAGRVISHSRGGVIFKIPEREVEPAGKARLLPVHHWLDHHRDSFAEGNRNT